MSGATAAIRARGLRKRFGDVRAVDGLELSVRPGEIYAFLGRNGAGKTTTIRMVLGLVVPDSGAVELFGRDVFRERALALAGLGYLVESAAAYPNLTVRENLEMQRSLIGAGPSDVDRAMALLGLDEYARRRAGRLSLGNKQRLSLARALVGRPRLLILDEPANGLDPVGIAEIRGLLKRLASEEGTTVFMSSHILGEVELLADRIGIVHRGRLVDELGRDDIERAGRRAYIRVDRPVEAAAALRAAYPLADVRTLEGGDLLVENSAGMPGAPENADIAKTLVDAGLRIERLGPYEEGLESRFMRLTGGME